MEFAFPLKQASLDSVHEKNVRHGHISTLHIWPARRPLAACRAALIATLLPDPSAEPKPDCVSDDQWQEEIVRRRRELCEKIGGNVVKRVEKKKMPGGQVVEREKEETEGGILHWGRETENAETLEWFRQEIRKAYGGRAPKVLDPFAGGGAIPLEAMRLGCEATAIDINPVAWFILKCTLEYPQRLAGQKRPLPVFILKNRAFMEAFFKAQGLAKAQIRRALEKLGHVSEEASLPGMELAGGDIEADLAWHVRAWGQWVLDRARRELARFYPVYADLEPLDKDKKSYERQPMRLVPLRDDGTPDIDALNADYSEDYLSVKANPRWVAKPTVAYLWARTVTCKNCRATAPLLKTRWLARTARQRVLLEITPLADRTGVGFQLVNGVPRSGGNNAQRREHDKRLGQATMSRAGATCLCCGTIMTMEDMQVEGRCGRLGKVMTAVAVDTANGKDFRLPTEYERNVANDLAESIQQVFSEVPFGPPDEQLVEDAKRNTWCVQYGVDRFSKLFTERQLVGMGALVRNVRKVRDETGRLNYSPLWNEALTCYLAGTISRLGDFFNCGAQWKLDRATINHLFVRYALPISWDFAEGNLLGDLPGSYEICMKKIAVALDSYRKWTFCNRSHVVNDSAISSPLEGAFDAVVTDPPYYNSIGYAVLMDYFYVWLRRTLYGLSSEFDDAFSRPLTPKWDSAKEDGELVDDASRHGGDATKSKAAYESGMGRVFTKCHSLLAKEGRLVIVFAHKDPNAWEALVSAMIRAGFLVDASWPIQTEQASRMRALSSSALASSVWLACRKRDPLARLGWDNKVLDEMRASVAIKLREYWDAGIRGPDFIWAATGPALEAYSKHPVVKMANEPNATLTVTEFLNHARRMVVDFVVGRVLSRGPHADSPHPGPLPEGEGDDAAGDRLDEPTAYYLLHRNDFGLDEAPVGACILYATACGLSDQELVRDWDLLVKTAGDETAADYDEDAESEGDDELVEQSGSGSRVKLKPWNQRRGRAMGYEAPGGRPVPLIDRIHRLMHLWKGGDVHKVDEYLDDHGLRRHELFRRVLQSLIELAKAGSEERSLLESLSNHIGAKGAKKKDPQRALAYGEDE